MILVLEDCPKRIAKMTEEMPYAVFKTTSKEIIVTLSKMDDNLELLMLDHDLGGQVYMDSNKKNTGMEVVRWIVKNKPQINKIVVHSLNYLAAIEMNDRLCKAGYNILRIPFIDINWAKLLKQWK